MNVYMKTLFIFSIIAVILLSLSCDRNDKRDFSKVAREIEELHYSYWQTDDTMYLQQGVLKLDSLLKTNLSDTDRYYCLDLKERLLISMGNLRQALTLRGIKFAPKNHPENYYEYMTLLSFCHNDTIMMKAFSEKAIKELDHLINASHGQSRESYLQRMLDISILCNDFHTTDSLFNLLKDTETKKQFSDAKQYFQESRSNIEDFKRSYTNSLE